MSHTSADSILNTITSPCMTYASLAWALQDFEGWGLVCEADTVEKLFSLVAKRYQVYCWLNPSDEIKRYRAYDSHTREWSAINQKSVESSLATLKRLDRVPFGKFPKIDEKLISAELVYSTDSLEGY